MTELLLSGQIEKFNQYSRIQCYLDPETVKMINNYYFLYERLSPGYIILYQKIPDT